MATSGVVVLSTAPDDEVAASLAAFVVGERLAACVNIVGPIRSLFWWDGAVQDDSEVLLICKTDADHLDALIEALVAEHPYDCPEVIALPIVGGAVGYLRWIGESLAG